MLGECDIQHIVAVSLFINKLKKCLVLFSLGDHTFSISHVYSF